MFFFAIIYGFTIGQTAILLVYNINFDPLISSFFGFYTLPIAYAVVQYQLLDIRVFAKRAIVYAGVIIFIAGVVMGINFSNDYFVSQYPNFPSWIGYFITSLIIGAAGIFIWTNARDTDLLKYEFVNVITHKFRTPLTRANDLPSLYLRHIWTAASSMT